MESYLLGDKKLNHANNEKNWDFGIEIMILLWNDGLDIVEKETKDVEDIKTHPNPFSSSNEIVIRKDMEK